MIDIEKKNKKKIIALYEKISFKYVKLCGNKISTIKRIVLYIILSLPKDTNSAKNGKCDRFILSNTIKKPKSKVNII